jgi:hypothetical protein
MGCAVTRRNLGVIFLPFALSGILEVTILCVLIYGLPIPLAALWFFRRKWSGWRFTN